MRVLFIGNSFTARNNAPGLIEPLVGSQGVRFEYTLISAGGASLRAHWNKGLAQQAIAEAQYDVVVLQEQSTLPVKNALRMHENIRLFDEAIRASGARTALYATWARQHEPQNQAIIAAAYAEIGKELGATVVPVGTAWRDFMRRHSQPLLHDTDKSHPTLAGSYLAACVFYAVLLDRSPVGAGVTPNGLTAADASALQRAAWAVRPRQR